MALWPGPKDSTFWFDFEGLTDDNLWPDRGPYGLHATPQAGFAAPNYGLARNAHGNGYANFTGAANVYATLPLRFYQYAPGMDWTLVLVARHDAPAVNNRLFYTRNVGATRGVVLRYNAAEQLTQDAYDAAGVLSQVIDTAAVPLTQRTWASIYSMRKSAAAGLIWHNRVGRTATWAGNANAIAYDAAVVPAIGASSAGGSYFVGRMHFLALLPFALTDQEAKAMSAWLMDQV